MSNRKHKAVDELVSSHGKVAKVGEDGSSSSSTSSSSSSSSLTVNSASSSAASSSSSSSSSSSTSSSAPFFGSTASSSSSRSSQSSLSVPERKRVPPPVLFHGAGGLPAVAEPRASTLWALSKVTTVMAAAKKVNSEQSYEELKKMHPWVLFEVVSFPALTEGQIIQFRCSNGGCHGFVGGDGKCDCGSAGEPHLRVELVVRDMFVVDDKQEYKIFVKDEAVHQMFGLSLQEWQGLFKNVEAFQAYPFDEILANAMYSCWDPLQKWCYYTKLGMYRHGPAMAFELSSRRAGAAGAVWETIRH